MSTSTTTVTTVVASHTLSQPELVANEINPAEIKARLNSDCTTLVIGGRALNVLGGEHIGNQRRGISYGNKKYLRFSESAVVCYSGTDLKRQMGAPDMETIKPLREWYRCALWLLDSGVTVTLPQGVKMQSVTGAPNGAIGTLVGFVLTRATRQLMALVAVEADNSFSREAFLAIVPAERMPGDPVKLALPAEC